jgi:proteic killer suppression protein
MRVEFGDADLVRICGDEAHKLGLPFAIIVAARRRLVQLQAAADERDLRNLKSLNYKKLKGVGELRSIRINDQYRIVFAIQNDAKPPIVTILNIGDTH